MIGKKELEELERLAKNATPGPWETENYIIYARNENGNLFPVAETIRTIEFDHTYTAHKKDAAYITAACNAVSELITENRKFKKQNDFFLKALKENFMCPYSRCKYDDGSELQEWECDAENNRECWIKAAKEA